jgi:hypothetical protein
MARPRKTLQAIKAEYGKGRPGRIYRDWHAFYQNVALPHFGNEKTARGSANRMMQAKYGFKGQRQIRNIISRGDALMRDIEQGRARDQKMNAAVDACREIHAAIEQALSLLQKTAYKDLLAGCAMCVVKGKTPQQDVKFPKALLTLSSAPEATAPDSWPRLAAVLARALLRAHEVADRAVTGYAERKPQWRS